MKLSILICTVPSRAELLKTLLANLSAQIAGCQAAGEVEVLVCLDDKRLSVGAKRNQLLKDASGEFVVFVDDDDDVADDYIYQIIEAIKKDPQVDCVGFRAIMSTTGGNQHQVIYSLQNDSQVESGGTYYRLPGHLTPLRKAAIGDVRFPEKNLGEDADFASTLYRLKKLRKEAWIDKVMYHYQFNPATSEAQAGRHPPAVMGIDHGRFDIVILSNQEDNLRGCLESIFMNEPALDQNRIVVVLDGDHLEHFKAQYPGVTWLKGQKPFVFARNANIGIKACPGDVILLNDDARLETRYGFSSQAYATKSRDEIGLSSSAIHGFVGNQNQKPWSRIPAFRPDARTLAFVSVFIPRDTINRIGLLDERFVGYGCLNAHSKVILSDGSFRQISTIYSKRQKVNVLSLNEKTGSIESKPVIGWWKTRGPEGQKWVKIHLKRAGRSSYSDRGSVFTPDHKLMTETGWKEASKVKAGDKIRIHEQSLSARQKEFILGSMLGDGSITSRNGSRAYFQVSHAESQWNYLDIKRVALGSWASENGACWTPSTRAFGKKCIVQSSKKLCSMNSVELADLRDLIYPNGKKTISWKWLRHVGPFGFAVFYMDDGFQQKDSVRLCCHDFGEKGTKLVARRLRDLGIGCVIDRDSRASKYKVCDPLTIRMRKEDTRNFMKLIGAWIPPSMRKKATDAAPKFNPSLWLPEEVNIANYDEVASVKEFVPKKSWTGLIRTRYCLSVKDNENFFTSSGLAHNCEDDDYCLRTRRLPLLTSIYDGCVVEHNSKENKSTYRVKPEISMLLEQNRKIFLEKWGSK